MELHLIEEDREAVPVMVLKPDDLSAWRKVQPRVHATWSEKAGFEAKAGQTLLLPGPSGELAGVLLGIDDESDLWAYAGLASALPEGAYRLAPTQAYLADSRVASQAALGFELGHYRFLRYRHGPDKPAACLAWPAAADRAVVLRTVTAVVMVRDLINTPASDLGPAELAATASGVAKGHGGTVALTTGRDLLRDGFPMVHAVGRASARPPVLIDIRWGPDNGRKVTLVGKGVCFDSGGLDLKSATGMALMKKDMGGAATVLGLAQMIMEARLDLRLRVLIPAVDNAVSGDAFRPGDVLTAGNGRTVEIGNTDAEGRLILADALTEGDREEPELLIDCATLTGAARVAVGPDLPALFTDDEEFAAALARHGMAEHDPHWRLPLYKPYRAMLESKIADINNVGEGSFAGAITAALFLQDFVAKAKVWAHFDLYAWNARARPGRPVGGEAMAMRALFALLAERYPPHA